ncbi:MAG: right-handed parallel beta-helix repeat-containing protein [Deltaproteobacteria bacterium]|nr:right-handed parallel beta-helix repeat-containing protein [Deltaproteobacteria bacterium]
MEKRSSHSPVVRPAILIALLASLVQCFSQSTRSDAAVLTGDVVWQGDVLLSEDVLVPPGVTLTIAPGTRVRVARTDSSKTDPEYLSPLVELTVRGTLRADGEATAPISFSAAEERKPGTWAGLLVNGGTASLRHCRVEDADTAVHVLDGALRLQDSTLLGNRYGLVLEQEKAPAQGEGNRITANEFGIVALGSNVPGASFAEVRGNRAKDTFSMRRLPSMPAVDVFPSTGPLKQPVTQRYGDAVLGGETVWRGRVEVSGQVRVPEGSRLVVLPGTVVEFTDRDTNGDGIGENGLLVQGVMIAKGTGTSPIVFRFAGGRRGGAGWDAVNLMNSAGSWNLFDFCSFENAYRALHFHFSRAAITNCSFSDNYRGLQFQESTVLLQGNRFFGNRSAIQARDSEVAFNDNKVNGNWQGVNFFRVTLTARRNRFVGNRKEAVRIREGATVFEQNLVDGNRYGLLVTDAFYGSFVRNCVSNNGETGLSLKSTDNLEISGNFVGGNGLNGISIQETGGRISRNLFSGNGERGIGIQSFAGTVEENNFSGNGLYAIGVEGSGDVSAPGNWWGEESPEIAIFDKQDDPAKGAVAYGEPAQAPFVFTWPLSTVDTGVTWRGAIAVSRSVTVAPAATLEVAPGTRISFSGGTGLTVRGKLTARGESSRKILFTALERREPGAWDEIQLENANGSIMAHCVVEYATWGVHSHFSELVIADTVIRRNYGGIRFRSGPMEVERTLLTENSIGLRTYRGNATVRNSAITGNEVGVFVREKGAGLGLVANNIFGNSNYNLRIGDFNDEDVTATGNWWGEGDPGDTIFDGRQEPGIGTVRFEPFLRAPLPLQLPKADG